MRRLLAMALAMVMVACGATTLTSSGISVPAGPQLDQFGLTERCGGRDSSCTDRALELAEQILVRLGEPMAPPEGAGSSPEMIGPLTIQVDHDPPWEWRAADGAGGSTGAATIDIGPFLAGRGAAEVKIDVDGSAYPAPEDLTRQLIDALFIRGG